MQPAASLSSHKRRVLPALGCNREISNPLLGLTLALVAFAAMQGGSFTRFGMWRQIAGATALFLLLFLLTNLVAKQAVRHEGATAVLYLPILLGLGLASAMLAWAGRRRGSRFNVETGARPA